MVTSMLGKKLKLKSPIDTVFVVFKEINWKIQNLRSIVVAVFNRKHQKTENFILIDGITPKQKLKKELNTN